MNGLIDRLKSEKSYARGAALIIENELVPLKCGRE